MGLRDGVRRAMGVNSALNHDVIVLAWVNVIKCPEGRCGKAVLAGPS